MLLSDSRRRLIYFCLAGMEVTWFMHLLLLFYWKAWDWSPWALFAGLLGILLVWISVIEVLNLVELEWPYYELAVLGLIVLSSLALVRFTLGRGTSAGDMSWLVNIFNALFNIQRGLRPELLVILTNLFLWQRAISGTSRDLSFFGVGLSFRSGILLLILSAGLFSFFSDKDVKPFLWLYFSLGLIAVAVARTHERATGAQTSGRLLPQARLAQLLLMVGVTVVSAVGLSEFLTPERVKAFLNWLSPLWSILETLLRPVVKVILLILEPALEWLIRQIRYLLSGLDWSALETFLDSLGQNEAQELFEGQGADAASQLPPWLGIGARYGLVLLAIVVLLGLTLLFLTRLRPGRVRDEAEEVGVERITLGGGTLDRGIRWLRDMTQLVRRYGMSRQLLAAISVENIYANLCRLARQRGYPRHPAQPPDDYLPVLSKAFAGQQAALARITAAYMQVHYGEHPVETSELAQLRSDYHRVRAAKKDESPPD